MDDEKPFKCPKCSQCFATSDHLVVHQRVHARENCDLLVKMPASSSEHVSDQTPTPTRFLKTADVDGAVLFEDINPFDHDFKLASKRNASLASEQNASVISSTVTDVKAKPSLLNCETTASSSKTSEKTISSKQTVKTGCCSKASSDDETEVSSSTVESNSTKNTEIRDRDQCDGSTMGHNQISSSTEEQLEVSVSLKCTEAEELSQTHAGMPITAHSSLVNDSDSSVSNPSAVASSSQQQQSINIHSSNDQNRNPTQTSLQSLLQQIQKQTNSADGASKATPASNSGTQSQEALREQLKSLIKSGQIKIKFTSDPSSPKVQATIVGNIAKKTTVTPRSIVVPNVPQSQQVVDPQLQQQEMIVQKEQTLQQKLLLPAQPTQVAVVQKQNSPKIQLPPKVAQKPLNSIQIKPKPTVTKPIPIAPKEVVSTCDSSISLSSTPMSVLSTSTSSTNTWSFPTHSASRLAFTKQKLKHVIQQNASNGTENPLTNGHISMASKTSSQGKYKDIVIDSDMMITSDCENLKQGRKQKGRLSDDCSPEEKRQRFLERNRAAAARCRQKRKIWVTQLESKSDDLVQTNNLLLNEINALRSEVAQLKALLLAHKDCPVTLQQKALLGQMTPGSYVAAVSDGQIIAIHQVPNGNNQASSAEEVATSALTDMAERATIELAAPEQRSTESVECSGSSSILSS